MLQRTKGENYYTANRQAKHEVSHRCQNPLIAPLLLDIAAPEPQHSESDDRCTATDLALTGEG
jgi:hypothetical protein